MKTCLKCRAEKPLDEFHNYRRSKDGKQNYCRPCILTYTQERDRLWESKRRRQERHRERLYGLVPGEYEALLALQDYRCGCCKQPAKRFVVDHDHGCCPSVNESKTCGQCIRGLVCMRCNICIERLTGGLADEIQNYLADPPARALREQVGEQ